MIHTSSIFDKNSPTFDNHKKCNRIYALPFSEDDVLCLQKIFIQCGVHVITTTDVMQGRKIIETIMHSLNYYHTIGCVTAISKLPDFAYNILKHPEFAKIAENDLLLNLENFFAVQAGFDFVWVELTGTIQKKYTIQDITNVFEMYHAQERMPVIIVMYEPCA